MDKNQVINKLFNPLHEQSQILCENTGEVQTTNK